MTRSSDVPLAIFMDLSAIFFAIRDLHPEQQLNYAKLPEVISRGMGSKAPRSDATRVAWTSYIESNQGQQKFLSYLASSWTIRRFSPSDSFMVDPAAMNLGPGDRPAQRLVRFDASIAFAIGALAKSHEIVVVSDSFALAEPLIRAAMSRGESATSHLAFFGRALDGRWAKLLREGAFPLRLIDLDDHEEPLFGARRTGAGDAFTDDFLTR